MGLWCAFELLRLTQDRLHAGFTVSSWSLMKSTLLQNKMGPRSYDAAMAFFLLIFLRQFYPFHRLKIFHRVIHFPFLLEFYCLWHTLTMAYLEKTANLDPL